MLGFARPAESTVTVKTPDRNRQYAERVKMLSQQGGPATCDPAILHLEGKTLDQFRAEVRQARIARRKKALEMRAKADALQPQIEAAEQAASKERIAFAELLDREPWRQGHPPDSLTDAENELSSLNHTSDDLRLGADRIMMQTADPSIALALGLFAQVKQTIHDTFRASVKRFDAATGEWSGGPGIEASPFTSAACASVVARIDEQIAALMARRDNDPEGCL